VGGDGDGFLQVGRTTSGHLGIRSFGSEYAGDWSAASVTQVRFWLRDVGADETLEIHFGIGTPLNFWQSDQGFIPPAGQWAEYLVDLTGPAGFTHIISLDGLDFDAALAAADRIHFRHDLSPYAQLPDPIIGDFGVDRVLLTNGSVGVGRPDAPSARPISLAPPRPNPARGQVRLAFEAFDDEPVRVQIVDAAGRMVREARLSGGRGSRVWTWDGRDGAGRVAPAGAYRARVIGAGGGSSRSFVKLP
jgi:hypothetical protein